MLNKYNNFNNSFIQRYLDCLYKGNANRKKSDSKEFYMGEKKCKLKAGVLRCSPKENNVSFYRNNKYRGRIGFKKYKGLKQKPYILYIKTSLRGFHINISDDSGKVLKMFSTGKLGYRKAQRYNQVSLRALSQEVLAFIKQIKNKSFKINIFLKGFGPKRSKFIRFFIKSYLRRSILSIVDLSDLPYNGCRPKKLRRK